MIGLLTGIIVEKSPPEILLDVQGVGYELLLPMTSFYKLPRVNEKVTIFTHLVIREDSHLIFGFVQKQERTLFRELIKTNGIGPKLALAILSAMSVDEFINSIEQGEISKLIKIPGVGRKTAERLLLELKGKFKAHYQDELYMNNIPNYSNLEVISPVDEARYALVSLGYKSSEAEKMLKKINIVNASSEQLIREALRNSL